MDRFTPCLFSYANIIIKELYNEKPLTYNLGQLSVLMQAAQPEPQDKSSFIMNLKIIYFFKSCYRPGVAQRVPGS